jgi:hypothetical protein
MAFKKILRSKTHLQFVAEQGCCICGRTDVQSAHIRYTGAGVGMKPCDCFTVPLCIEHHQEQHSMNERMFWHLYKINPIAKALALCAESPDKKIRKVIFDRFSNHFDW